MLIEFALGADINAVNIDNWTALRFSLWPGNEKVVQLIIDKGADLNIKDSNGDSTLHRAILEGKCSRVQVFRR